MWNFFNDVLMEEMFKDYPSFEIESNRIPKKEKEKWKWTFKSCMFKKLNGNLMVEMHFIEFFSLLLITKKLIIIIF
jgi:hypothetical protein